MVFANEAIEDNNTEEEYLDELIYTDVQHEELKQLNNDTQEMSAKRKLEDTSFDDDKQPRKITSKDEINFQLIDNDEDLSIDNDEAFEDENDQMTPKDAMNVVLELAQTTSMFNKLQSIEQGKAKDSMFVSKTLDLLFDRITLANSSAFGQKCQSKLNLPPKPPLDKHKMDICMKAFLYRLRKENISTSDMQRRLKHFNKLVNDKIQNCRKCLTRTDPSKILEM